MSFFRYDGSVRNPLGFAVAGCSIAVLTQPADVSTQPGSPLATIYEASTSNSASVTAASFSNGHINFTLNAVPADVVSGSFISVSGVNPSGYNGVWQVFGVSGNVVSVETPYQLSAPNPGAWVSGGTVATSALPNPFQSDNLGNYFFYAAQGSFTLQIYDTQHRIQPLVFLDQIVVSPGGGSVTSVALTLPTDLFAVTGSPVTSSGTIAGGKANVNANYVLCGPVSGSAAPWTVRLLTANDISGIGAGSVTSVAASISGDAALTVSVTGSPVTTSGTLAFTVGFQTQPANLVLASPSSGGTGAMSVRALVGADLPLPSASTLGGVESYAAVTHQWINQISTSGVPSSTQPAFSNISGVIGSGQITATGAVANQFVTAISSSGVGTLAQPSFANISGTIGSGQITATGAVANQFVTAISSSGVGTLVQPSFSNLSGAASATQKNELQATISFSATPVFDASVNGSNIIVLTANVTSSTLTGGVAGQRFSFIIKQDGVGSHTLVFPTNVKGAGTIASTLSGYNVQDFIYDGTNWLASSSMQSFV